MDCQNWEPVVLKKSSSQSSRTGQGHHNHNPASGVTRRLEEDELPLPKKMMSPETRQKMIQARVARSWNQQQLATQCALPVSVIRDIENGRVVPSGAQLNILNRLLGGGLKLEER